MSRNLQSQTKLTEFAPLSPEVEDGSSFGNLFSRFFKRTQPAVECDKSSPCSVATSPGDAQWKEGDFKDKAMEEKNELAREFQLDVSEGRSLPNVLKRISNLLALKNTGRRSYNDTELKQYWMPDSVSKECYDCGERFTTFRRRHHCRVCGQIFCAKCCNQEIPGKIMNCTGDLRVCMYCGKVVLSYVQSGDMGGVYTDLRALHEDLLSKFGEGPQSPTPSQPLPPTLDDPQQPKRKPSVGYQEERFAFARAQGMGVGQAMLESGYIEGVEGGSEFQDGGTLYRVTPIDTVEEEAKHDSSADSESEFIASEANLPTSNSIFNLNLNLEDRTAHVSKPPPPLTAMQDEKMGNSDKKIITTDALSEGGVKAVVDILTEADRIHLKTILWNEITADSLPEGSPQRRAFTTLKVGFDQHCGNFLRQLLNTEGASQSWAEIIAPIANAVTQIVRPDYARYDEMDIRQYVQFKKVPGGERSESEIIKGVVCSKNVVHRKMPTSIVNPKILLLSCAIVYQRVEGKFLSLEPVIMQESDYIGHAVARISALSPDLVLVGRGASRLAQESLLALGISLALNVKASALERISRLTGADILSSVDARLGKPRLGTCRLFYVRPFPTDTGSSKTLMVLEGCPEAELGCTVILRGGSYVELAKIKRVARTLLLARYNSRLEFSYLMDASAAPPFSAMAPDSFLEDTTDSSRTAEQSSPSDNTEADVISDTKEEECGLQMKALETLPKEHEGKDTQAVGRESRREKDKSHKMECDKKQSPEKFLNSSRANSEEKVVKEASNNCKVPRRERVTSEERAKVAAEAISDFSDPLHLYLSLEDEHHPAPPPSTSEALAVAELPLCNKFRKALDDNVLSISPFLKFTLPYLESEPGRHCKLRPYFGQKIYWSSQFNEETTKSRTTSTDQPPPEFTLTNVKLLPEHEFVRKHLTEPAESIEVRALVAEYRACGGRLPLRDSLRVLPPRLSRGTQLPPPASMDVLHPPNHQKISVLFCSYSPHSNNAPGFCVDPWVVEMELYGRNDIPLGLFLERYCWRSDYTCPAGGGCSASMLHHTRRFVHDGGAIKVSTRRLDSPLTPDSQLILLWNWCMHCKRLSGMVGMSPETWCLSFAKYLELRFHGDMYTVLQDLPPACHHSLHHDHIQYFAHNNIVVSFGYSKISVWEISLPPLVLETDRETCNLSAMLEDVKTWSLIGHQMFSVALNKLCSFSTSEGAVAALKQQLQKDQAQFKSRVEEIQTKLSSCNEEDDKETQVRWGWSVDDGMVLLKRLVAEGTEDWNIRLSELERKKDDKRKSADIKPSTAAELQEAIMESMGVGTVQVLESPEICGEAQLAEEADMVDPTRPIDTDTEAEDCDSTQVTNMDVKPPDKKTVKTILSQLLPTAPNNIYIQNPMNQTEHHCLPLGFPVPIVVYEREPSSIIAYALSSHEYRNALDQLQLADQPSPSPLIKRKSGPEMMSRESLGETTPPPDPRRPKVFSFLRTSSTGDGTAFSTTPTSDQGTDDDQKSDDAKTKTKAPHSPNIEVQFADSTASFKVKVYFADEFARLRSLVVPGGEEAFVRSLSRCVSWAATGGKSGSNFSKTKDDRFILKEMSRIETHIFINFAPQYFTYMETCVRAASPTLLGKIVGVFRVGYRNAGATYKSNLLVMEHLFHARPVTNKFDLKGSVRNRLVDTSLDPETVLLDENLINMTCDSPLYILPHSKTILMQAIHNDTQFLATQSVMDYSLLVGLDHTNKELVVGIIDYIRTFTWDKKLENMVKKYGFLGQGKQPTIISPDEYRDRFIAAMHRYFLPVPDRWTGLGKGIDP